MGLGKYLSMEGLTYKLMRTHHFKRMDLETTKANLDYVYKYRGIGDAKVPLDINSEKLLSNYGAAYIQYIFGRKRELDAAKTNLDKAKTALDSLKNDTLKYTEVDSLKTIEQRSAEFSFNTSQTKYDDTFKEIRSKTKQVLTLLPKDWRTRTYISNVYLEAKDYETAEGILTKGAELDPERFEYHYSLGNLYRQTKREDEALESWKKVIYDLDSKLLRKETAQAAFLSVNIYRGRKDFDGALTLLNDLDDFARMAPESPNASQIRKQVGSFKAQLEREKISKPSS